VVVRRSGPARPLIAWAAGAALLLGMAGCGGSGSSSQTSSTTSRSADRAAWAAKTQQLCREKRVAIAQLGYVHITYGGIARLGVAAVKHLLDRYLTRLLAVQRYYYQRQGQLPTPAAVAAPMAIARAASLDSQGATQTAIRQVAAAKTVLGLTGAFRRWALTLERLGARQQTLAHQLDVPGCFAAASTPSHAYA
jgi:hypothetical protein